eukprot:4628028-Prorocentrum_lima.AAC.1
MTSSLVGSEMCIRDSSKKYETFWTKATHCCTRPGMQPGPHSQTEFPVSYTHLTLPTICSV